jgi:energy-converting hydrogenase Eha subunit F
MLGSVLGYFFSIIVVFAAVMTFMTLLIGVFDNSTFEKLRHYPRPIIEGQLHLHR